MVSACLLGLDHPFLSFLDMRLTILDFEEACIAWYKSPLPEHKARLMEIKRYLVHGCDFPMHVLTAYQAGLRRGMQCNYNINASNRTDKSLVEV